MCVADLEDAETQGEEFQEQPLTCSLTRQTAPQIHRQELPGTEKVGDSGLGPQAPSYTLLWDRARGKHLQEVWGSEKKLSSLLGQGELCAGLSWAAGHMESLGSARGKVHLWQDDRA